MRSYIHTFIMCGVGTKAAASSNLTEVAAALEGGAAINWKKNDEVS
jgi:hypothetical protein